MNFLKYEEYEIFKIAPLKVRLASFVIDCFIFISMLSVGLFSVGLLGTLIYNLHDQDPLYIEHELSHALFFTGLAWGFCSSVLVFVISPFLNNQTPGQWCLGLRLVSCQDNNLKMSFSKAFSRFFCSLAFGWIPTYLLPRGFFIQDLVLKLQLVQGQGKDVSRIYLLPEPGDNESESYIEQNIA